MDLVRKFKKMSLKDKLKAAGGVSAAALGTYLYLNHKRPGGPIQVPKKSRETEPVIMSGAIEAALPMAYQDPVPPVEYSYIPNPEKVRNYSSAMTPQYLRKSKRNLDFNYGY